MIFKLTAPETLSEKLAHIHALNEKCRDFWSQSQGWAPDDAAELLTKSRLDWQVSLTEALAIWTEKEELTDGEIILAWTNLGALVEGTLKLFLSVYYADFQNDIEGLKSANAYDHKKATHKSPDGLNLETMRVYVKKKGIIDDCHHSLIELVQQRRNAIHAFKDRDIGNRTEFLSAVEAYYELLHDIEMRLPYPDH